ncbi:MAG: ATP-binding protein [Gemmatimonadaceae bacterium]|nr:ATP-binding protein [Gemmatimonadaceae bacterium]
MSTLLDGGYRFDTFVIGSSNRLAVSAAHAVAESPGTVYNPLFVYGGSGLGKTHLVAALAFQARLTQPALRVEFSTGEEVAERLHKAIASGQQAEFARRYQEVDLLLLDDVQFLTGQRETQTELLRLFNLMQGKGRQLVMTSDRPPADIPDVDQRLLSRLSGGLIVDVGAPDYEMRLAILRNAIIERSLAFDDGVLEETARLPFENVRELKGALNRLSAFQQLEGQAITADDVRAVLGEQAVDVHDEAMMGAATVAAEQGTEYEGFLADVLQEVETRVEQWRVYLGEACAFWRAEGYATAVLERAMALPSAPEVNGLLATFAAAVEHLRNLEAQSLAVDPSLRGHPAFRNPELVADAQLLLDRAIASALPLPAPLPGFTRAALEVGTANQLTLKAFDSVLEHPGQRYNPLLVHGPSGVGKTHVAHALGNAVRAAWPRKAVACVSATAFVEELVAAMQEGGVERWRSRYRAADVLIVDDVHHLADKERTQEELFHLFNHLYDRGSQIVLTSDRAPRDIVGLADRLRSRFEGGLVATLQAPDRGLRERLIHRWLLEAGHEPGQALVALLADRDARSVRELVGLMTRLQAAAEMGGRPLTLELAQRELGVARTEGTMFTARAHAAGALDDFFLDREKVIWAWPDLGGRLIEEYR